MTEKIFSSNPPGVREILKNKFVFIAGAGGLGSNVAIMLVRAGIEHLAICDFDVVAESNLNRQAYFLDHVGMVKVEALKENLKRINPECRIELINARLSIANFANLIPSDVDIIFECFDDADCKAELFSYCLSERKKTALVMVSGLAGIGPVADIQVKKIAENVWLVGDEQNEMNKLTGTLSSRVIAAAAIQAHTGIRILLGLEM